MNLTIQMFAGAREIVGADVVEIELADGATYRELADALVATHPALADLIAAARFATDAAYVTPEQQIDPSAEIALIPPVSGG